MTTPTLTVQLVDLIGVYLGTTTIKTQEICDKIQGGTLVIEGSSTFSNSDYFKKECLDTLKRNPNITVIFIE